MTRTEVKSSHLKSVGYDPSTETLEIEFYNDQVYQYQGVPARVFQAFLNQDSLGQFFSKFVKNKYKTKKVEDNSEEPKLHTPTLESWGQNKDYPEK